jgi:hypothetical protein
MGMKRLFSFLSPDTPLVFGAPSVVAEPLADLLSENLRLCAASPAAKRRELDQNRRYGAAIDAAFRSDPAFAPFLEPVLAMRRKAYIAAAYESHTHVLDEAHTVSRDFAVALSSRFAETDAIARAERGLVTQAAAFGAVFRHGDGTLSRASEMFDVLVALLHLSPGSWGASRRLGISGVAKPVAALATADRVKLAYGPTTHVAVFAEEASSSGLAFVRLSYTKHSCPHAPYAVVACRDVKGLALPVVRFNGGVGSLFQHSSAGSAFSLVVIETKERQVRDLEDALSSTGGIEDELALAALENARAATSAARDALRAHALCTLDSALESVLDTLPPDQRLAVSTAPRGTKTRTAAALIGDKALDFLARTGGAKAIPLLVSTTLQTVIDASLGID